MIISTNAPQYTGDVSSIESYKAIIQEVEGGSNKHQEVDYIITTDPKGKLMALPRQEWMKEQENALAKNGFNFPSNRHQDFARTFVHNLKGHYGTNSANTPDFSAWLKHGLGVRQMKRMLSEADSKQGNKSVISLSSQDLKGEKKAQEETLQTIESYPNNIRSHFLDGTTSALTRAIEYLDQQIKTADIQEGWEEIPNDSMDLSQQSTSVKLEASQEWQTSSKNGPATPSKLIEESLNNARSFLSSFLKKQ